MACVIRSLFTPRAKPTARITAAPVAVSARRIRRERRTAALELTKVARSLRATWLAVMIPLRPPALLAVLLVADLFHPVDILAVQRFLNGNVCHRRCSVPMLQAGRKPDHVAGPN